ncbi:MAG: hypothetical protein KDA93_09170 [Planctomycetaceae bacterium]|nr:hypothetical protein [Planctomycetaceae bacterium]
MPTWIRRLRALGCLSIVVFQAAILHGEELPLLVEENFDQPTIHHWAATDPDAWRLEEHDGGRVLHQFQQSRVQTPVRSPFNRNMLRGQIVSDFQLDVDLQSTARDYPHRSLCLFFGYQDPAHFYYVHLGQRADDHANQIFIVNEQPRTKISTTTTEGTPWDDEWHHVRIKRNVESGSIEIFFDDMETPVMTATDKKFQWGEIGLGSFDDTGRFDNLVLRGMAGEPE